MDIIAPPPHPPPPSLPPGWKAIWNEQYKTWFYVNEYTKASQWDMPTEPARPEPAGMPIQMPQGPPPAYEASSPSRIPPAGTDEKLKPPTLGQTSSNPFRKGPSPGPQESSSSMLYPEKAPKPDTSGDEELARRLQAEEDEQNQRPQNQRPSGESGQGAANDYYASSPGNVPGQQVQSPPDEARGKSGKRGFLSSLFGRKNGHSSSSQYGGGYGPRPPQMYGRPPQPMYGGPGFGGGYGGYPQQPMYGGPPPVMYGSRPSRPGMGAGAGLALGAGAGLLGGALLNHEMNDAYRDGYEDARDDYDDRNDNNDYNDDYGDYGGGDFNGGDFDGGDFGGGDW